MEFTLLMSSSAWLSSAVVLFSFLLACGNSRGEIPLVELVSFCLSGLESVDFGYTLRFGTPHPTPHRALPRICTFRSGSAQTPLMPWHFFSTSKLTCSNGILTRFIDSFRFIRRLLDVVRHHFDSWERYPRSIHRRIG